MKHWRKIASLVLLGLILVAGIGCNGIPNIPEAGPAEVARQWYEAVGKYDGARMYELTHPGRRADLEVALKAPVAAIKPVLGLEKRDYFEMRFTVLFNDGQTAFVRVTGKEANRLGMISTVNETVELRRHEGQWRIWAAEGWF